jgi:hypothetical protein
LDTKAGLCEPALCLEVRIPSAGLRQRGTAKGRAVSHLNGDARASAIDSRAATQPGAAVDARP